MFVTLANGYRRKIGVAVVSVVACGTLSFALAEEKLASPFTGCE